VPRDEVDNASFAEVAERDLRLDLPGRALHEPRHGLGHPSVTLIEDPIERGAPPPRLEEDADVEDCGGPPQCLDADVPDLAALDPGVG